MSNGIYTALSGAVAQEEALAQLAHNFASIQVTGFKGSKSAFAGVLASNMQMPNENGPTEGMQVFLSPQVIDLRQGEIRTTGYPFDLALQGPGFFQIQTPEGDRLTRDGHFSWGTDGTLQTRDGYAVLGTQGPIRMTLSTDTKQIDQYGQVVVNDTVIDKLRIVDVDHASLQRVEHASFRSDEPPFLIDTPVQVGALESSNVNGLGAMTRLIGIQRAYENQHQAIRIIRGVEQKLTSEIR